MKRLEHMRILMYSHDTFGLGHLRRCRTIAHALVERFKGLFVLIISGSQITGAFDFRARVDFVKIPSVIKLYNGEYTSIDAHIDTHDTLAIRQSIIRDTARSFDPDIFIVDKEPLGLKGEIEDTLAMLKANGTTLVLGMRDVMDSPTLLKKEWAEKDILAQIDHYYDDIWVYGPEDFWDPLTGLNPSPHLKKKIRYTGFLERSVPGSLKSPHHPFDRPYLLVTAGGGGDGKELMEWVLAAYEADGSLPFPLLLVLGPFMPAEARNRIEGRVEKLENVEMIDFDNRMELLVSDAAAMIAMGGYNTFCETLSFDIPTIIVPRVQPREEQLIRAQRAQ
ncbi:MAG: hypothetical protein K8F25_09290, partial [Fimbriimonadaceae bacterium]|nr:hypothetical protein [Alphaproteobacteria bacterium]